MKYAPLLMLPLFVLLSSCAKMMNENECLVADWRTIGFQDGSAGLTEQQLAKRGEACAEFGVAPDMDQYLLGRDQGLRSFCIPRRGFDLGRGNVRYNNVCPSDIEGVFLSAYQDGRGLRSRENHVADLDRAVQNIITELNVLEQQLTEDAIVLATVEMTTEERIDYALALKEMAEERGRLSVRLPQIQSELEAARMDLSAFASSIASKYPGAV